MASTTPKRLPWQWRGPSNPERFNDQVFPLDDRYVERADPANRPEPNRGRKEFGYYGDTIRIPEGAAVNIKNTSFAIAAELTVPAGGAEGMIINQGGWFGGFALMLLDGKPTFSYSRSHYPEHKYKVAATHKIP